MSETKEQYKIKFRKHRQLLEESLQTECIVSSLSDVKKLFDDDFFGYEVSELVCEYYGSDNRGIGYDETYIVTAILDEKRVVLGFSNAMLE